MAIQTSMSNAPVAGREGMLYDNPDRMVSAFVEIAAGIKAGRAVVKGTNSKGTLAGDGAILPTSTGLVTAGLLGFSMWDPSLEPGSPEYPQYAQISIVQRGRIWMIAEDAVTKYAPVFVRFTAAGAEELGRVRSDADGADAVAAPGCRYLTTTSTTNQLVLVEINLP